MSAPVYNNHTPAGRAKIDRVVLRKMGRREWTRGLLASALPGLTPRMVSDSLRRLVAQFTVERVNGEGKVSKDGRTYRVPRHPQARSLRRAGDALLSAPIAPAPRQRKPAKRKAGDR